MVEEKVAGPPTAVCFDLIAMATRILHGIEIFTNWTEFYPRITPVKFGEIPLSSLGGNIVQLFTPQ